MRGMTCKMYTFDCLLTNIFYQSARTLLPSVRETVQAIISNNVAIDCEMLVVKTPAGSRKCAKCVVLMSAILRM